MNKVFYLFGLIFLFSCVDGNLKSGKEKFSKLSHVQKVFSEVDSLLKIDNGKFWNHQLYGSILIIDPETREFIANKNNSSGDFKKVNAVYLGTLPKELNIANTAINWNDERWTMVMLPLPTDKMARNNLVIHELFHHIQPEIGFGNLQEHGNVHLDTYEGRLLLKLELEALKKALNTDNEKSQNLHLKNALIFRITRQSDVEIKMAENSLEVNEGLAEYTAIMLSGRNNNEMKLHLTNSVNQFYTNPTYVRSFAYQTTPIYGYLLSKKKNNWQKKITRETNLTDFFIKSFAIDTSNNKSVEQITQENEYNYKEIVKKEKIRENKRAATISEYKKKFLKEPTLKLYFKNMNISFDPRNITPLGNSGTVYPTIRVTDNWGVLTVKNGALLSSDWTNIIISAPTTFDDDLIEGDGWTLELNKGWTVHKTKYNFELIN